MKMSGSLFCISCGAGCIFQDGGQGGRKPLTYQENVDFLLHVPLKGNTNFSNMVFIINIRFNAHRTLPIEVEPWWVVKRLKTELELVYKIPADEIRVIFQGRELHDAISLEECDLGDFSVLHAVRGRRSSSRVNTSAVAQLSLDVRTQDQGLNNLSKGQAEERTDSIPSVYRPRFFVYCKRPCERIQPGKLRVRCASCEQGTITVDNDPCGWEDVLHPNRVTGICQSENCDGRIAEFFFKCSAHQSVEDDSAVALDRIRSNLHNVPCITCVEIENPILVFPCEDGHVMCLDCFRLYCTTKLNDRSFTQHDDIGYTLPCPAGCENSYIQEAHHFRVLGNDQYERYQRFGTEECLLRMGGVLCPGRGCGAGLLPEPGYRQVICLQGCKLVFCKDCLEAYHEGDCESAAAQSSVANTEFQVDPHNAVRARWDQESRETIKTTTKPCPQCKVPVEKAGGCMHIKCTRCYFEWCWQCSTEWNRDCQGDHWFG